MDLRPIGADIFDSGPKPAKTDQKPAQTGPPPGQKRPQTGPNRPKTREETKIADTGLSTLCSIYGGILDLSFGFGSLSGQTWPQDAFKRARLEK